MLWIANNDLISYVTIAMIAMSQSKHVHGHGILVIFCQSVTNITYLFQSNFCEH